MNILEAFEYNQHFVAMMNIINKAKPPTNLESNHKLLKGKPKSQEFKDKLSKNNGRYWKDKKRDKEWCDKHSKAMKEYWLNKRNNK